MSCSFYITFNNRRRYGLCSAQRYVIVAYYRDFADAPVAIDVPNFRIDIDCNSICWLHVYWSVYHISGFFFAIMFLYVVCWWCIFISVALMNQANAHFDVILLGDLQQFTCMMLLQNWWFGIWICPSMESQILLDIITLYIVWFCYLSFYFHIKSSQLQTQPSSAPLMNGERRLLDFYIGDLILRIGQYFKARF